MSGSGGLGRAIKVDLKRLHETWMELLFQRQRGAEDTVLGKYTPDSTAGMAGYRLWGALGAIVVAVLYPFAVVGFGARYYAGRLDSAATRLGILGVVVLAALAWGALTVVSLFQFSTRGFVAVAAASVVATVSAALAVVFSRVGGRATTVLVAYPFAVTAVTMPPVVAAFFSTTLAGLVFENTDTVAVWVLDNVLAAGGVAEFFRESFDLEGAAYAVLWFAFSLPVGWFLGILVSLANLVRPSRG
jgi:hypothetical protein